MALFIAADSPLSVIAWRPDIPAFHVVELPPEREAVRLQFRLPHIYYVGGPQMCSCPFNYGRECPECEDDPEELAVAVECVARFIAYVRESKVRQIYTCQFDEECEPRAHQRSVTAEQLLAKGFVFRDRELLEVEHAV